MSKLNNSKNSPAVSIHQVSKLKRAGIATISSSLILGVISLSGISAANAAEAPITLGTASSYSVLGGQTVTNTGPSVLGENLGLHPGTATPGFPPGLVLGSTHIADAVALQAQSDLVVAYDDAAGRAPTANVAGDLVGQTLVGGVYKSTGPLAVSGTLTLDGQGDPQSVFVFQVASTLDTASASAISLTNGAQACNVYWQVGSSATLGTASAFKGTIMALTSIAVTTDTTVEGRALARNGEVTLDNNVFTAPGCETTTPTPPPAVPVPSETSTPAPSTGTDTEPSTPPVDVVVPSPVASTPVTGPSVESPSPVSSGIPAPSNTTSTGLPTAPGNSAVAAYSEVGGGSGQPDELAETGLDSASAWTLGTIAVLAMLAGLAMVLAPRFLSRKH